MAQQSVEWGTSTRIRSAQPGSLQDNTFDFPSSGRFEVSIPLDGGKQLFFSLPHIQDIKSATSPLKIKINLGQEVPENYSFEYTITQKGLEEFLAARTRYDRALRMIESDLKLRSDFSDLQSELASQINYWMAEHLFREASGLNTLDPSGENFVSVREPNENEDKILQQLQDIQVKHHPRTIRNLVEANQDGNKFVEHLMRYKDEQIVRVGLSLITLTTRGGLQDTLVQVAQDKTHPQFVRDWATDLIFPERRRLLRI